MTLLQAVEKSQKHVLAESHRILLEKDLATPKNSEQDKPVVYRPKPKPLGSRTERSTFHQPSASAVKPEIQKESARQEFNKRCHTQRHSIESQRINDSNTPRRAEAQYSAREQKPRKYLDAILDKKLLKKKSVSPQRPNYSLQLSFGQESSLNFQEKSRSTTKNQRNLQKSEIEKQKIPKLKRLQKPKVFSAHSRNRSLCEEHNELLLKGNENSVKSKLDNKPIKSARIFFERKEAVKQTYRKNMMKKYLSKPQKTMPSSKTTSFHQEELENLKSSFGLTPSTKFSKEKRDVFKELSQEVPGPGSYEHSHLSSVPGGLFGSDSARKEWQTREDSPGPAAYKPSFKFHSRKPSTLKEQ